MSANYDNLELVISIKQDISGTPFGSSQKVSKRLLF